MTNNRNIVSYINTMATVKKKLPMSKRVKGENYVLFVDGHYVPFGEVYHNDVKDHYVHYGHFKNLSTAKAIAALHLIATGRSTEVKNRFIAVEEELLKTIEKNRDIKKLFERAQATLRLESLLGSIIDQIDYDEDDILEDYILKDSSIGGFSDIDEDDIPF